MSYEQNPHNPSNDDAAAGASTPPPGPTMTMPRPPAPAPAYPAANTASSSTARRVVSGLAIAGVAVVGAVMFFIALVVALFVALIVAFAGDGSTEEVTHTPTAIVDVPTSIVSDDADVLIDLTSLSADDFEGRAEPLAMDIDVEFGEVRVIVPEGVTVAVDAETSIGSITVFEQVDNGFNNRVVAAGGADADIDLTIDVEAGEVDVDRG